MTNIEKEIKIEIESDHELDHNLHHELKQSDQEVDFDVASEQDSLKAVEIDLPPMALDGMDFVEDFESETEDDSFESSSQTLLAVSEEQDSLRVIEISEDTQNASASILAEELSALSLKESEADTFLAELPLEEEQSEEERFMSEGMSQEKEEAEVEIPHEFIEHSQLISIIESVLFATDKPLSVASIHQIFKNTNIKPQHVRKSLDDLQSVYADAYRGVTLEEVHGGYQLRTKLDNAEFLKRVTKVRPFKLSGPSLETMAIVAYKQPITKSEVDQIRGVESGHLVRALMERGLVQFAGKSELPGRPMFYGTTKKFLDIFGLRNLNELPTLAEIDDLIPEGIGGEETKLETLSDLTDRLSEDVKVTYSEGEEELTKISEQLSAITTSSDFFEQEKIRQKEKRDMDRATDLREALTVGEAVEDKDLKWLQRYDRDLEERAKAQEKAAEMALVAAELATEVASSPDLAFESGLTSSSLGEAASQEALSRWQNDEELEVLRFDDSQEELQVEEISLHSKSDSYQINSFVEEKSEGADEETTEKATDDELDAFLGFDDDGDDESIV